MRIEEAPGISILERFCLEAPTLSTATNSFGLRFVGWFIGRDAPVDEVSVVYPGRPLLNSTAPVPREDIVRGIRRTVSNLRAVSKWSPW